MRRRPIARPAGARHFVGCVVGDVRYALPVEIVREIVNPLLLVELPAPPPAVLGVTDHRGELLPVISLRACFALPAMFATRRTKWIVTVVGDRPVALVVDAVTEVFATASLRPTPELGADASGRGVVAVADNAGSLVFVLDPTALEELHARVERRDAASSAAP